MSDEPVTREAMQQLLAPLSPSWVADQVGVTRQQVDRWKNGHNISAVRLAQVVEAVHTLLPDYEPAAPPEWATRLAVRLRANSAKLEVSDEDLRLAEAEEAAEEALRAAVAGRRPRRTDAARAARAP